MPTKRSSAAVVLGVLVAVIAVVIGTTAASGWRDTPADESATGTTGRTLSAAAAPGPDAPPAEAPGSLFAALPPVPAAAADAAVAAAAGEVVARGADLLVERVVVGATTTYRVTITAGPYVMRDMPAIVSADGAPLGIAAESVDLASLVLYTVDDAVVTDGVEIALSYGLPGDAPTEWSTTVEVSE